MYITWRGLEKIFLNFKANFPSENKFVFISVRIIGVGRVILDQVHLILESKKSIEASQKDSDIILRLVLYEKK